VIVLENFLLHQDKNRWYEAAYRRVSTRRYGGAPTGEQINLLAAMTQTLALGGVRIVLLPNAGKVFGHGLMGRRITGVTHGAGFVLAKDTPDWCAGYVGEAFILECAALDLGTCWMVATFSHKAARAGAGLREGERLLAVTPIGRPEVGTLEPLSDDDRPRKSIPKLTGLSDKDFEDLPEWQREAVLCARSGPSAMNHQPWVFTPEDNGLLLQSDPNSLDTGIAMFHVELAAAVSEKYGRWSPAENGWRFTIS